MGRVSLGHHAALFFCCSLPIAAHDPITTKLTWTRDISRIVNRRCIPCHDADASVPLAAYETARPWAKAIRDQVMTRKMPPWGAVPGFGPNLAGDPSLAQIEIDTVVRWVEGGAPKGDEIWLPYSKPPLPEPRPSLAGPLAKVGSQWRARGGFQLLGIRPNSPRMRVTVTLPSGAIEPVLWLRDYPPNSGDFVFSQPLQIPASSVVRVLSAGKAVAQLKLIPAAASPRPPGKENRK